MRGLDWELPSVRTFLAYGGLGLPDQKFAGIGRPELRVGKGVYSWAYHISEIGLTENVAMVRTFLALGGLGFRLPFRNTFYSFWQWIYISVNKLGFFVDKTVFGNVCWEGRFRYGMDRNYHNGKPFLTLAGPRLA